MELNPVRAGLTPSAGDYVWSSAITHLGGPDEAGVVWLDAWRSVWSSGEWAEVLGRAEDQAAAIREATYSGGRPFGSESFLECVQERLGHIVARGKPGRRKALPVASTAEAI